MFNEEYVFYGKHARMVKELNAKINDLIGTNFFATIYDIYRVAPLIGYIYNRKGDVEKTKEKHTKIFRDKMQDEHEDLTFNYRVLMMLLNNNKTDEEVLNIAFRMDDKDEERKQFDHLYNRYVLGGVEEIYEKIFIVNNPENADDYLMNLFEFIEELRVRLYKKDI